MSPHDPWQHARGEVLLYGRRMREEHLVRHTAGNISVRVPGEPGRFAVTPTSLPYDTLEAADIVIADVDGNVVDGLHEPTSEFPLHTLVYRRRPEVGAIVHTHSPAAMTMAALNWTLPPILTGFVAAAGGAVATARYARPGTPDMADATTEALTARGACFLQHHGLLAIGATLARAYDAAATTEGAADVYLRARLFGEVPELADEEVRWLAEVWRAQWRLEPPAGA
jgi:ribulose-5-phosphate 4-epimerase/fuculose-1-phosphate aldolase